tara:strand:+ start:4696 stop:4938 length:243 start_codon:yes stop_codon:yes gene_type:complete
MVECGKCKNHLKAIGKQRKNGKDFEGNKGNDWDERKFCKKCYKLLKEQQNLILFGGFYTDDQKLQLLKIYKERYSLKKLL